MKLLVIQDLDYSEDSEERDRRIEQKLRRISLVFEASEASKDFGPQLNYG